MCKICDLINKDVEDIVTLTESGDLSIVLQHKKEIDNYKVDAYFIGSYSNSDRIGIQIRFCPFCGKELPTS